MKLSLRHLAWLAILASPVPAIAQAPPPVELSAAEVFRLAEAYTMQGQMQDAEALLLALLSDPKPEYRDEARFRLGRLRAAQGDLTGAIGWYRALLDHNPGAAFVRIELARTYALAGDEAAAARELRRAGATGLPEDVARIVDQFSVALRSQRPLGGTIELAIAPDSNINRAASGETIGTVIGDLEPDEDAKAQSGIGVAVRAQGFARIDAGKVPLLSQLSVYADIYGRSQFNDVALAAAVGPDLSFNRDRLRPAVKVMQRWFGNDFYSRHIGATLNWRRMLSSTSQIETEATLASGRYRADYQDGLLGDLQVNYDRAFTERFSARASARVTRANAEDPGYALTSGNIGGVLAYRLGALTLILEASGVLLAADERLALFPRRRSDTRIDVSAGILLSKIRFADLSPIIRLRHNRNWSTIDIYDINQTRMEFGFSREF